MVEKATPTPEQVVSADALKRSRQYSREASRRHRAARKEAIAAGTYVPKPPKIITDLDDLKSQYYARQRAKETRARANAAFRARNREKLRLQAAAIRSAKREAKVKDISTSVATKPSLSKPKIPVNLMKSAPPNQTKDCPQEYRQLTAAEREQNRLSSGARYREATRNERLKDKTDEERRVLDKKRAALRITQIKNRKMSCEISFKEWVAIMKS